MSLESLYIGKNVNLTLKDLSTHVFVCGATGSGKTVLSKSILEEALLKGISVLAFDIKGDISSMIFPLKFYTQSDFERFGFGSLENHYNKLKENGYSYETIKALKTSINLNFYSPFGNIGKKLGFSPIPKKPLDKDLLAEAKNFAASNLISLIKSSKDLSIEKAFLQELIAYYWSNNTELWGLEGLKKLISSIVSPPILSVGVRNVDDFISPSRRENLANLLNASFVANKELFAGIDINDFDSIIGASPSLTIIDLSSIQDFNLQSQIIALTTYSIFNWMKAKGQSDILNLLLFIDEIGGGGASTALLPSDPYFPPSKIPLRLLLRQGRAFGVGLILATQSPGDVDYKSLANSLTWFVGKLIRQKDRKKVLEIISDTFSSSNDVEKVDNLLSSLDHGSMLFIQKNSYLQFRPRWLLIPHKTLSKNEKMEMLSTYISNNPRENIDLESKDHYIKPSINDSKPSLTHTTDKDPNISLNNVVVLQQFLAKIISDVELKAENLKNALNENLKEHKNILDSIRIVIDDMRKEDILSYLNFIDSLSTQETFAIFDGSYVKKTLFSSKTFTAPLLFEQLKPLLEFYTSKMQNLEDLFSYFGDKRKVTLNNDLKDFIFSLRNTVLFNQKTYKQDLKKIVKERIVMFFNSIVDDYENRITIINDKIENATAFSITTIEDKLKTEKDIYELLKSNIKRYLQIYDFILTYKPLI